MQLLIHEARRPGFSGSEEREEQGDEAKAKQGAPHECHLGVFWPGGVYIVLVLLEDGYTRSLRSRDDKSWRFDGHLRKMEDSETPMPASNTKEKCQVTVVESW